MQPSADQIVAAARALTRFGLGALVWLDDQLRVTEVLGTPPVPLLRGVPISESISVFFGLEESIAEHAARNRPFNIQNVGLIEADGSATNRYELTVIADTTTSGYFLMITVLQSANGFISELEHEQKRSRLMERDIAERTLEVQRINAQLEEFTYVISHDLNAPLRAIRLLNEDVRQSLAHLDLKTIDKTKLDKTIDAIGTQTRRMSNMLTGLLEYARVGRTRDLVEPLDLRNSVREVVASFKRSTRIQIAIRGQWPTLETPRAPFELVIRNLVDNAIKHHDRPQSGHIRITARPLAPASTHLEIDVSDDGPGIEPEWHEAIFEAFRRVDDVQHPDSSGLGLALIRKAARSLGGEVTVHSEAPKARGTTFTVRWPLKITDTFN